MDVSRPAAAVSPGVESDVLVVLAGSTVPRSGRELARLGKRSPTGVQHALDRLVDEGLVERVEAGRARLYTLNRDHLLASAVEEMASARQRLLQRLRDLFFDWAVPPHHASLFGSAARGDGGTASDIDLLVVRSNDLDAEDPQWRGQLHDLAERVHRWTGNPAGIAELAERDLTFPRKDGQALVEELLSSGIDLGGIPLRRLLRSGRWHGARDALEFAEDHRHDSG
ncbi:MAG: nucleotidyltransferase domain-containing protein [Solirubrobacterales bacterium]